MLDSTRQFLNVVSRSGLVAQEELVRLFSESTDDSSETDVDEAARLLMRSGRLTAWQIERLQVGQTNRLVLGNYELLEPIGRGGMGDIYKARHRHLDRIVALKTVLRTDVDDSDHIARFQREMRALERLDHPRIVRVYDAGSDEGTWFLVMEYIERSKYLIWDWHAYSRTALTGRALNRSRANESFLAQWDS